MAIENIVSLTDFEQRRSLSKYIPREGENVRIGRAMMSFSEVRSGEIEEDKIQTNASIILMYENIKLGDEGSFKIGCDPDDEFIYKNMYIASMATLICNNSILKISTDGTCNVYGKIEFGPKSVLHLYGDNGSIRIGRGISHGIITFNKGSEIWGDLVHENMTKLYIDSALVTDVDMLKTIVISPNIIVDKTAVVKITDGDQFRPVTVNDILFEICTITDPVLLKSYLMDRIVNVNCRYGIKVDKTTDIGGFAITVNLKEGRFISGDLDLAIFKLQDGTLSNRRILDRLVIEENAALVCQFSSADGNEYYHPRMIVGDLVDDANQSTTADRGGEFIIKGRYECNAPLRIDDGYVNLCENGTMIVGETGYIVLNAETSRFDINGTLVLRSLDQIEFADGAAAACINVGEHAKIIVTNEDAKLGTILHRIGSNGSNTLARNLFHQNPGCVEYNIPTGAGIQFGIDVDPSKLPFLKDWYNDDTLIHAIAKGEIVWHDDAFIEMPRNCMSGGIQMIDLISSMFRTTGHTNSEKIQEVANAFRYAGAGNVTFRFFNVNGDPVDFRIYTHPPRFVAQEHSIAEDKYFVKTDVPDNTGASILLENNVENVDDIKSFKNGTNITVDSDSEEARFKIDGKGN